MNELTKLGATIVPFDQMTDKMYFDFLNQHKIFISRQDYETELKKFEVRQERSREFDKNFIPLEVQNSNEIKKLKKQIKDLQKMVKEMKNGI